MKKKLFVLLSVIVLGSGVLAWYNLTKPPLTASGKPMDPRVIALNKIESEIQKLNDREVLVEIERLMSVVNKPELMEKYNKNLLNEDEKKNTKAMLTRLALLNVEKKKRNLGE